MNTTYCDVVDQLQLNQAKFWTSLPNVNLISVSYSVSLIRFFFTFFSSHWSIVCVYCLNPNQISFRIINNNNRKVILNSPSLPLTFLHKDYFSKYRQRRQNPHLALSFTRSQVYAGCMQHFACTGKKK